MPPLGGPGKRLPRKRSAPAKRRAVVRPDVVGGGYKTKPAPKPKVTPVRGRTRAGGDPRGVFPSRPGPVRHAPRTAAQRRAGRMVVKRAAVKADLRRALDRVGERNLERVKSGSPIDAALAKTVRGLPLVGPLLVGSRGSAAIKRQVKGRVGGPVGGGLSFADRLLSGKVLETPLGQLGQALHSQDVNVGRIMESLAGGVSRPQVTGGGGRLATAQAPVRLSTAQSRSAGAFSLNAVNDLLQLPANAIPALYVPAREAEQGNFGKAGRMLLDPYVEAVKHPGKSFSEHPVGTALLFSGLEGTVGRGAGKALRTAPSKRARSYASLGRPSARGEVTTLPNGTKLVSPLVKERRASKDIFVNRAQKAKDRKSPAPRVGTHEVNHRVDQFQGYREDIRRQHRDQILQSTHEAVTNTTKPTGSPKARVKQVARNRKTSTEPSAATVLSTQNIARPHELEGYLAQLREAEAGLTGARLKQNRENQAQIQKALKTAGPKTVQAGERYAELSVRLQEGLVARNFLPSARAEKARLISYAVQKMGARHSDEAGIVAVNGKPLNAQAIREHMKAEGYKEPAFVSHAPGQGGGRNFSVRAGGGPPPKVAATPRTGQAVTEGTLPLHDEVLREQSAKAQGMIDAHDAHADFLRTFALHKTDGSLHTQRDFQQAYRDALDHNAEHPDSPVRPVRVSPFSATKEQLGQLVDDSAVPEEALNLTLNETLNDALSGAGRGEGPWALVPDSAASRMQEHIGVTSSNTTAAKTAQVLGAQFRSVVLATNPKWLAGNHIEGVGRLAVAHAGPRSWITGRNAIAKADPALVEQLKSLTVGGGHYALQRRASIINKAERFQGTAMEPVANAMHAFFQAPGPKTVAAVWHGYTNFVFKSLNGRAESSVYQTALLGKALRDHPLMDKHTVKLSNRAVSEVAQGISKPEHMAELADQLDRMYGKYNAYGPSYRKLISGVTPFLPWSLSALRFVLDVLPRDHPVFTSLIASSQQASEDWLRQHGQVVFGPGRKPGFLQGSIPGEGDSNLRISHYTPFSLWGDPLGTLGDSILPQVSAMVKASEGRDWQGNKLKGREGDGDPDTPDKFWAIVSSGSEAFVPLVGQMTRFFAYEGTTGHRLRKVYDPFMYTEGRKGGETVLSEPSTAPQDRRSQLLDRRAQMLNGRRAAQSRTEAILERRARLLSGRTP